MHRQHRAAADALRKAITHGERLVAADPNYVFYRLSVASALNRLSAALAAAGRAGDSEPLARRVLEMMETFSRADPHDVRLRVEAALACDAMGNAIAAQPTRSAGGRSDAALVWYRRSLDILEQLRSAGTLAGGTLLGDEPAKIADLRLKISRLTGR